MNGSSSTTSFKNATMPRFKPRRDAQYWTSPSGGGADCDGAGAAAEVEDDPLDTLAADELAASERYVAWEEGRSVSVGTGVGPRDAAAGAAAGLGGAAAGVDAGAPKLNPVNGLAGFGASATAGFAAGPDDDVVAGGAMLPLAGDPADEALLGATPMLNPALDEPADGAPNEKPPVLGAELAELPVPAPNENEPVAAGVDAGFEVDEEPNEKPPVDGAAGVEVVPVEADEAPNWNPPLLDVDAEAAGAPKLNPLNAGALDTSDAGAAGVLAAGADDPPKAKGAWEAAGVAEDPPNENPPNAGLGAEPVELDASTLGVGAG